MIKAYEISPGPFGTIFYKSIKPTGRYKFIVEVTHPKGVEVIMYVEIKGNPSRWLSEKKVDFFDVPNIDETKIYGEAK